jgi:hypothetical protein
MSARYCGRTRARSSAGSWIVLNPPHWS